MEQDEIWIVLTKRLMNRRTPSYEQIFSFHPGRAYRSVRAEIPVALNTPGIKQNELELAEHLVQLFKDEEKICAVPRTVITGGLVFYGIPYRKTCEIYEKLMEEVNRKYVLIHPDSVEWWGHRTRKRGVGIMEPKQNVVCPFCGKDIPPESRYCLFCGQDFSGQSDLKKADSFTDPDATIQLCKSCGVVMPSTPVKR